MSEDVIEADPNRDAARIPGRELQIPALEFAVAAPEHRQLRGQSNDGAGDVGEKVQSFLGDEAAHDAQQRNSGLRSETERALQHALVLALRVERCRIVLLCYQSFGGRSPL